MTLNPTSCCLSLLHPHIRCEVSLCISISVTDICHCHHRRHHHQYCHHHYHHQQHHHQNHHHHPSPLSITVITTTSSTIITTSIITISSSLSPSKRQYHHTQDRQHLPCRSTTNISSHHINCHHPSSLSHRHSSHTPTALTIKNKLQIHIQSTVLSPKQQHNQPLPF